MFASKTAFFSGPLLRRTPSPLQRLRRSTQDESERRRLKKASSCLCREALQRSACNSQPFARTSSSKLTSRSAVSSRRRRAPRSYAPSSDRKAPARIAAAPPPICGPSARPACFARRFVNKFFFSLTKLDELSRTFAFVAPPRSSADPFGREASVLFCSLFFPMV